MSVLRNVLGDVFFFLEVLCSSFLQLCFSFLPTPDTLLQWTVSSSILILVVLLLRLGLKGRVSCRVRYALWAVVLVRLLLPFQLSLSLPYSAAAVAPETPSSWEQSSVPVFPSIPYDAADADPNHQDLEPGYLGPSAWAQFYVQRSEDGQTMTTYVDLYTPGEIVQSVWWVGALILALILVLSNLRFYWRLRGVRRPLAISQCPCPVYAAEGLPSPCLFGLFRPAIYLTPEAARDETTLRHVLAHELTHRAHGDHIWALLRCVCLALHWCNPLVWLAVALSKGDSELACDEGAVKRLGESERLRYGRTLVDMVACRGSRPTDLLSCSTSMTGGKKTVQQRVKLLVKRPHTVKAALFAALAVVALAAVFTFSSARTDYYQQFRTQLEQAQSVSVSAPLYSSVFYPDPITDADLLEQVKALLADPEKISVDPEELESSVDFSNAAYLSYRLVLDQETIYYFYYAENQCYVLLPQDPDDFLPEKWHYAAVFPTNPCGSLMSLAKSQYNRGRTQRVPLTEEELDWFNGGNFFDNNRQEGDPGTFNIRNQFLTSLYDSPEDIDLGELFYNGSGLSSQQPITQAEYDALGYDHGLAPLLKVTAAEMDQVLLEHTGLTLDQTNKVGLSAWQYFAQYGAYYHMHGDTNYNTDLTFTSGTRDEDIIYLYYTDQFGILGGGLCVLTLRQEGEHYYFQANQRVPTASGASFLTRVARTQSIYYTGPSYSSVFYPGPIVDSDLLEEAKDLLAQAQEITDIPAELDLARASVDSHRVILTGGDGAGQTYLLFQQDDLVYVLTYVESAASDYPIEAVMTQDALSALSGLAQRQSERDRSLSALTSDIYSQAMEQLLPRILDDPDWSQAYQQMDLLDNQAWNDWLFQQLEQLGFSPAHTGEGFWNLSMPGAAGQERLTVLESYLSYAQILDWAASPTRVSFTCPQQDPDAVAQAFGQALARMYLDLNPRHPNAVTFAQLVKAEVYEQAESGLCARITLAVDPAEPNTTFWMAGAGISPISDGSFAGHWDYTMQYRLISGSDGVWHCDEAATGGLNLAQEQA